MCKLAHKNMHKILFDNIRQFLSLMSFIWDHNIDIKLIRLHSEDAFNFGIP